MTVKDFYEMCVKVGKENSELLAYSDDDHEVYTANEPIVIFGNAFLHGSERVPFVAIGPDNN